MTQRRVAVALNQQIRVTRQINALHTQRRGLFVKHQRMRGMAVIRIFHAVVDVLVPRQIAEIRQKRMAAVKHTQLHLLERHHIAHQLRARLFPRRAARDKIILNHPLAERLAGDTRRVAHAGQLLDFIERFRRHRRHDTVHHGGRERHVLLDPRRQAGIHRAGERHHDVARHMPVFRHIIAGHHAKARKPGGFTARQRLHNHPNGGGWRFGVREIGGDQRIIQRQLTGGGRMAVAFFGDGQRNNRHLRLAQRGKDGLKAIHLRMQRVFHHAHHAGAPGVGGHFRHGVEIILTADIGDLLLAADQIDFTIPPVAAVFGGKNIGIDALVRAVKRAKTEMHNAGDQRVAVIGRERGVGVKQRIFHGRDSFDK
ncbi:RNA binding protein, putative [Cronobacter turicensis 564]|nr:RNA binding protein, putative [Cronobacter turicensis 564]